MQRKNHFSKRYWN